MEALREGATKHPVRAREVSFRVPAAQPRWPQDDTGPEVGFSHIALEVSDMSTSTAFYARYAGMQVVHERGKPGKRVVWLSDLSRPFAIVLIEVDQIGGRLSGIGHLGTCCSSTAEVDRLCKLATEEDRLILGPTDDGPPVGYWALLRDPDGHNLELSYGQQIALTVGTARSLNL